MNLLERNKLGSRLRPVLSGLARTVLFALILILSCTFKVAKDPGVLIMQINSEPGILNPILATDSNAYQVLGYIYETLLDLDNETLEYKPLLAESWEVSEDHHTYTFNLRKDVKWQDGYPFTADDIIYSYSVIMDPKVDAAVYRAGLGDIENVEKLSDHSVKFVYKKPYFRGLLVCGGISIVPKHIFDDGTDFNKHPANRNPIGTGPYIFKEWKTKRKIVLESNGSYWKKPPELKGLVFQIIEDSTVPLQQLKKGEIDMAELRAIQWERSTGSRAFNARFNKVKYYLPQYSYIGWNIKKPFFSDARVRRAMSMMIDKQKILEKLSFGLGIVVEGPQYYFSDSYGHNIKPDPFDPKAAAKLLDEAGWIDHDGDGIRDKDGIPFKFDYCYVASSVSASRIGTMLREDLSKTGIVMNMKGLEFNALIKVIDERSFDAITLAWSVPFENDPYQLWHSSQIEDGSNYVGFSNKEADEVIEAIRVEFDKEKRDELYKRLQMILHIEQPYTFLFNPATLLAYSKRFTNVKLYKVGVDIREWGIDTTVVSE
ncbi:MAG: peptide-binding protein [Deltaproteobacteria bacterium CG11_big_fil_rev_8_21_14_0_20_49_13]|nr:MAG: peptide-binding protein [Deltaproteobacteria bacterium CG11_big_fil_rev_8_21_14_0_20_49_13]